MPIRRQQPLWQSACPRTPAQRPPHDIHQSRHRREGFWIAIVTERIDPCLVLTVRTLNVEFVLQEDEIPLAFLVAISFLPQYDKKPSIFPPDLCTSSIVHIAYR